MTLTRPVAECLLRLKHDQDLQALRGWLTAHLQDARDKCESLEGVQLHRAQGRAQAYGELMRDIENAPALLEKVRQQK